MNQLLFFLKLADKLNEKGHKYYDENQRVECAVFWELEGIVRQLLKESEGEV